MTKKMTKKIKKCENCGFKIIGEIAYFKGKEICQECWIWHRPKNVESKARQSAISGMKNNKNE